MHGYRYLVVSLLLLHICTISNAQNIKGQVVDLQQGYSLENATVFNIHQKTTTYTGTDGIFNISVSGDDLIEFSKEGYKTYRVRIPKGSLPPFFKIGLEKPSVDPNIAASGPPKTYRDDSLRYYYLYKRELDFQKFSTIDMLKHPFSAMSKHNRQIWAFQDEFSWFQEEKYINYTFTEKLVTGLTGLTGDSLQSYMRMFRPSYNELRSMSEYTYYGYIKKTVDLYRKRGERSRMSPSRSTH